jgi:WD40 repeat protein
MSADGSPVGSCLVPKFDSQSESHPRAICLSLDSCWVAVSGRVNSVTIIDAASLRIVQSLDEHTRYVSAIAFFGDSCKTITGAFDERILHWRIGDWKVAKSIQHVPENGPVGKEEMIVAVAVGRDDDYDRTFSQLMTSSAAHRTGRSFEDKCH